MRVVFCLTMVLAFATFTNAQRLSLAGTWKVQLDSMKGKEYKVQLPGTLDDAGIGFPVHVDTVLNIATMAHLSRKVQYTGKASYSSSFTVPAGWKHKRIKLILGRVIWKSSVAIDGKQIPGEGESLVTEHRFDVTDYVVPGKRQTITVNIDNSDFYPGLNIEEKKYTAKESKEMVHAYTNHTQIKWNGVLGEVTLHAQPLAHLTHVTINPDPERKVVGLQYEIENTGDNPATLSAFVTEKRTGKRWTTAISKQSIAAGNSTFSIPFNADAVSWSEFSPAIYQLTTIIESNGQRDSSNIDFGIRFLSVKDGNLQLNGRPIFIRGNLECVIFPATGYPIMKKQEWGKLFAKAKSYGLNSFRFHSWCPPEAAFAAADALGFYLQVELPHWNLKVGEDTSAFLFLKREADRILSCYGNHPSFMFFSMGNELEGDFDKLNGLVADLKGRDNRHLYSTTTFTFQKGLTGAPQPQDDYYVTQWTKKGWVRGQVVFNDDPPSFSKDYSASLDSITVPIISHEIGQYSVYPDMREIAQYTGNLRPLNFIAIKNDLEKKKMLQFSQSFLLASGKLASLLYKEEIERALKTKGMDGYQLLQLQDFPGQGTALVGLLNAFWQSKGAVTAKEFHQYNSEVTSLIRFPKAVYTSSETFVAQAELANYYKPLQAEIIWQILDENKSVLKTGSFGKNNYSLGSCLPVGQLELDLRQFSSAKKLTIKVLLKGTNYQNQWNIWVYPSSLSDQKGDVFVTASVTEAFEALQKGKKVLLSPSADTLNGIKGKFVPVFWSPVHFPDQPGTMGLLIKNKHAALKEFPTDFHSDWQWWDLTIKSKALLAGNIPDKAIIVRPIDNFVNNRSLTNLFEAKFGAGRLIFCSIDIITGLENRPQAKQLKYSLLKYMNGKEFNPSFSISEPQLKGFFK